MSGTAAKLSGTFSGGSLPTTAVPFVLSFHADDPLVPGVTHNSLSINDDQSAINNAVLHTWWAGLPAPGLWLPHGFPYASFTTKIHSRLKPVRVDINAGLCHYKVLLPSILLAYPQY